LGTIYYARTGEFWRKGEKYDFLDAHAHVGNVEWEEIEPNRNHTWLTAGMQEEFESFLPMGNKEAKAGEVEETIFTIYSPGIMTGRDIWVYNFKYEDVEHNVQRTIEYYNDHV
jgi:predicted helicase